jgi:hypothetical protein
MNSLRTVGKDIIHPCEKVITEGSPEERAAAEEMALKKVQKRIARRARRGPDPIDMVMGLRYILVPQDRLEADFREAKEKRDAAEQKRVQEIGGAWAEQVASQTAGTQDI